WLKFQQGFVNTAEVFHVERAVVDTFAGSCAASAARPEEIVEQLGDGSFGPVQPAKNGRGGWRKQCARHRADVEFGALQPVRQHAEQGTKAVLQEASGLRAVIEDAADDGR